MGNKNSNSNLNNRKFCKFCNNYTNHLSKNHICGICGKIGAHSATYHNPEEKHVRENKMELCEHCNHIHKKFKLCYYCSTNPNSKEHSFNYMSHSCKGHVCSICSERGHEKKWNEHRVHITMGTKNINVLKVSVEDTQYEYTGGYDSDPTDPYKTVYERVYYIYYPTLENVKQELVKYLIGDLTNIVIDYSENFEKIKSMLLDEFENYTGFGGVDSQLFREVTEIKKINLTLKNSPIILHNICDYLLCEKANGGGPYIRIFKSIGDFKKMFGTKDFKSRINFDKTKKFIIKEEIISEELVSDSEWCP